MQFFSNSGAGDVLGGREGLPMVGDNKPPVTKWHQFMQRFGQIKNVIRFSKVFKFVKVWVGGVRENISVPMGEGGHDRNS